MYQNHPQPPGMDRLLPRATSIIAGAPPGERINKRMRLHQQNSSNKVRMYPALDDQGDHSIFEGEPLIVEMQHGSAHVSQYPVAEGALNDLAVSQGKSSGEQMDEMKKKYRFAGFSNNTLTFNPKEPTHMDAGSIHIGGMISSYDTSRYPIVPGDIICQQPPDPAYPRDQLPSDGSIPRGENLALVDLVPLQHADAAISVESLGDVINSEVFKNLFICAVSPLVTALLEMPEARALELNTASVGEIPALAEGIKNAILAGTYTATNGVAEHKNKGDTKADILVKTYLKEMALTKDEKAGKGNANELAMKKFYLGCLRDTLNQTSAVMYSAQAASIVATAQSYSLPGEKLDLFTSPTASSLVLRALTSEMYRTD